MTQTVLYITASLDGMIADADGGVDWLVGGDDTGYAAFSDSVGAIITGRATYDQVRGFDEWPYAGKTVYVLSHTDLTDLPEDTHARSGAIAAVVEEATAGTDKNVWILGGADVAKQCIAAGVLDEMDLFIQPVILGEGIDLFSDMPRTRLRLLESQVLSEGLVRVRYAVEHQ